VVADASGYFPGSRLAESFRSKFEIERQKLPELNVYPAPAVANLYPAFVELKAHRIAYDIQRQGPPELNQYTETPATLCAYLAPKQFNVNFDRRHLTALEINVYPAAPSTTAAVPPSYNRPKEPIRQLETARRHQFYKTTIGAATGDTTSPATLCAYLAPQKFKVSFDRRNLTPLELNVHPATPVGSVPAIAAWSTQGKYLRQKRTDRAYHSTTYIVKVITSPAVYPSFLPPTTFRVSFERNRLEGDAHLVFPATPAPIYDYPSYLMPPTFKVEFERRLQMLPDLDVFTATPPSGAAIMNQLQQSNMGADLFNGAIQ